MEKRGESESFLPSIDAHKLKPETQFEEGGEPDFHVEVNNS